MCVSLRVPFDLLALLFSTCDSDTLELVICPPPPPSSCPATSCASLSILLLCAQIVRHDRKSLSHAAAALDAAPPTSNCLPLVFWPVQTNALIRETHTCTGKLNFSPERACVVIIVIDIAHTHSVQAALELLEQGTRHLTLVKQNRN